ncbi:alpha-galactosidase [Zopfochytrium polystomum]|nr:alpha-galactosidase [Zopfochytrium polystomum]
MRWSDAMASVGVRDWRRKGTCSRAEMGRQASAGSSRTRDRVANTSHASALLTITCTTLLSHLYLIRTPAMGWNSWNLFACDVNETIVMGIADKIKATGLGDLGYQFINIDDCWQIDRNPDGSIVVDSERFPSGIPLLSNYVHSLGLKFGLYSSAGDFTCQGRPGGLEHEVVDANTYAKWEVDYFKYDNCWNRKENDVAGTKARYNRMRDALNATGRPIVYSICNWGEANIWEYGAETGHSWRTTGDICDTFDDGLECSVTWIMERNAQIAEYSGPGGFNDLDMLEVGNGGMTPEEYRTHFSVWAALKSPLLLGNDVTKMTPEDFAIISNPEVIAISQDALGAPVLRVQAAADTGAPADVWVGPLANGDEVVLVVNRKNEVVDFELDLAAVLADGATRGHVTARDLWKRKNLGHFSKKIALKSIPAHGTEMLRIGHRGYLSGMNELLTLVIFATVIGGVVLLGRWLCLLRARRTRQIQLP